MKQSDNQSKGSIGRIRVGAVVVSCFVISLTGWLLYHTTYPAMAFVFGLWGGIILSGDDL